MIHPFRNRPLVAVSTNHRVPDPTSQFPNEFNPITLKPVSFNYCSAHWHFSPFLQSLRALPVHHPPSTYDHWTNQPGIVHLSSLQHPLSTAHFCAVVVEIPSNINGVILLTPPFSPLSLDPMEPGLQRHPFRTPSLHCHFRYFLDTHTP